MDREPSSASEDVPAKFKNAFGISAVADVFFAGVRTQ